MFTCDEIKSILDNFAIAGNFISYGPIDDGHINDTFRVVYDVNGKEMCHLLQRINTTVFKKPDELMANVDCVTSFLRDKIIASGGDTEREAL